MRAWSKDHTLIALVSAATLVCSLIISFIYLSWAGILVNPAVGTNPVAALWEVFVDKSQPAAHARDRLVLSRLILVMVALQGVALVGLRYQYVKGVVVRFFSATTQPVNLAVFRIVFFSALFIYIDLPGVLWFSELPRDLVDTPRGWGQLVDYFPINPSLVTFCSVIFVVCSVTSIVGLFTRSSVALVLFSSAYLLSVPQFFGKIEHIHHLLWFTAILVVSPCGDALSLDATWAAWRRADAGSTEPPSAARAYALPLRFVWLLIGIIYFFPGLRKAWDAGFDWVFSDNLKFHMYAKWFDLGGWTPFFRIDQYPLLVWLSAAGTIIFELVFIFLIFYPRIRPFLAVGGVLFHAMIDLLMHISFWTLQVCYVAFFDWHTIFHRVGKRLYRRQMYVVYDGNCKICRRTIASLRVFDLFGRITYINALDDHALASQGLDRLDRERIMSVMHAVVERRSWAGYDAYRAIAARIPLLWPVLPFLYLWPVEVLGKRIYRRVADRRTCSIGEKRAGPITFSNYYSRRNTLPVLVVGTLLVLANTAFGFKGAVTTWPLAAYPPFSDIKGPQVETMEVIALSDRGDVLPLGQLTPSRHMSPPRWHGMARYVLSVQDQVQRRKLLGLVLELWTNNNPKLQAATSLHFYKTTVWTDPLRKGENPVRRELLDEYDLSTSSLINTAGGE